MAALRAEQEAGAQEVAGRLRVDEMNRLEQEAAAARDRANASAKAAAADASMAIDAQMAANGAAAWRGGGGRSPRRSSMPTAFSSGRRSSGASGRSKTATDRLTSRRTLERRVVYKGEYKHSSPYAPPSQRLRGRKNTSSRGGEVNFGTRPWSVMVSRVQWRDGRQIFGRAILIRDPQGFIKHPMRGSSFTPSSLANRKAAGANASLCNPSSLSSLFVFFPSDREEGDLFPELSPYIIRTL